MAGDVLRVTEYLGHIREAIRRIKRYTAGVPWDDIYFMRNRLAHGYATVDLDVVWKVVERDVPELDAQVERLLVPAQRDKTG
ncbi:MAG: DUF86 domain-containing protein [Verrucomicrobia bacterium]|nr:DUF86 domain-containing protein [Verrucomicrobiota bacterium]